MLNKLIPFVTQIVLIPTALYFIRYVIIPNKEEAIVLISGLISISAILAALSFSASGTYSDSDKIK